MDPVLILVLGIIGVLGLVFIAKAVVSLLEALITGLLKIAMIGGIATVIVIVGKALLF